MIDGKGNACVPLFGAVKCRRCLNSNMLAKAGRWYILGVNNFIIFAA